MKATFCILPLALAASACMGGPSREEIESTRRMNRALEAPPAPAVCAGAERQRAHLASLPDQARHATAIATVEDIRRRCNAPQAPVDDE